MAANPLRASLFVLAAISPLFCLLFAPLLDHHFAERQPIHMHLYFGPVNPDHLHSYPAPHAHLHGLESLGVQPGEAAPGHKAPNGTVSLASHDAITQSLVGFSVTCFGVAADFLTPDDAPYSLAPRGDEVFLDDAFLAPLKKPPRV